jgi:acyl-CoA thioester hydrolase
LDELLENLQLVCRLGSRDGSESFAAWLDAYRHVNNAVYATYLEECRDELADNVLAGIGDVWDYVLARVAIDYRRELTQDDDAVVVQCTVDRIGNSSITLREEIRTLTGELAAEAEAVLVARDPETGRSRPLTEAERAAFERFSIQA